MNTELKKPRDECFHLYNAELSRRRYWRGPKSQEVGNSETIPNATTSVCVHDYLLACLELVY